MSPLEGWRGSPKKGERQGSRPSSALITSKHRSEHLLPDTATPHLTNPDPTTNHLILGSGPASPAHSLGPTSNANAAAPQPHDPQPPSSGGKTGSLPPAPAAPPNAEGADASPVKGNGSKVRSPPAGYSPWSQVSASSMVGVSSGGMMAVRGGAGQLGVMVARRQSAEWEGVKVRGDKKGRRDVLEERSGAMRGPCNSTKVRALSPIRPFSPIRPLQNP